MENSGNDDVLLIPRGIYGLMSLGIVMGPFSSTVKLLGIISFIVVYYVSKSEFIHSRWQYTYLFIFVSCLPGFYVLDSVLPQSASANPYPLFNGLGIFILQTAVVLALLVGVFGFGLLIVFFSIYGYFHLPNYKD